MGFPSERPSTSAKPAAGRMSVFGLGMREVGVSAIAVAVLLSLGMWWRSRGGDDGAEKRVRADLAMAADAADVYRDRFGQLQKEAAQMKAWAEAQRDEPLRTWARERAKRMEALLAAVNREPQARGFVVARKAVEQLLEKGEVEEARARVLDMPTPAFPLPSDFERLKQEKYEDPVAELSRQNPTYYRAFRQMDPAASKRDETKLRSEIAASGEAVTPQTMLKVELLAAVAAPDDPVVVEWSSLASAMDYFESPDGATLARWRRAQAAQRAGDWTAAATEMQQILRSKVLTRQPFRAAYGRALLKSRPDAPGEAYPFLAEAAAAGDKQARAWVTQEDLRQKRFGAAQRWLEAAVADGDKAALQPLLDLYEKQPDGVTGDARYQTRVIERVVDRGDSDPAAELFLGRLYERTDPAGSMKKAFGYYQRATAKGSAAAAVEVARCALRGEGTPENLDQARDAATRAFAAGEREAAAPLLSELMRRSPDRTAMVVLPLFETEQAAGGGGYMQTPVLDGPWVTALKGQLASYLDRVGLFGRAARFYAGSREPAAKRRHAELTMAHPCDTCGGTGKIQVSAPCPTCGGKGKQSCASCGGTGITYVPGTPPCTLCGGSGTMIQDRKVVACSSCGGTGKGKGTTIKQDCTHCDHGFIKCPDCNGGSIKVTKDCPDCHGRGTWSMVERASD